MKLFGLLGGLARLVGRSKLPRWVVGRRLVRTRRVQSRGTPHDVIRNERQPHRQRQQQQQQARV